MKRPTRTWLRAARRDTFDALACALYDIAAWLEDHVRDRGAMTSRRIGGDDEQEWLYDNRERAHMETCRMCNPKLGESA